MKKTACECLILAVEAIDDYLSDIAKTDQPPNGENRN
jgi:hypothetical protein